MFVLGARVSGKSVAAADLPSSQRLRDAFRKRRRGVSLFGEGWRRGLGARVANVQ